MTPNPLAAQALRDATAAVTAWLDHDEDTAWRIIDNTPEPAALACMLASIAAGLLTNISLATGRPPLAYWQEIAAAFGSISDPT